MQDALAIGDEIITAGGIHGDRRELGDDELQLEIAPGVVVTLDRRAVAARRATRTTTRRGDDADEALRRAEETGAIRTTASRPSRANLLRLGVPPLSPAPPRAAARGARRRRAARVPGSPIHKELRKGLDLQGGLEVVLQAQPPRATS